MVPVLTHEPPRLVAPVPVEDAAGQHVRRVLGAHIRAEQELQGAGHEVLVREVGQGVQVTELILRGRRRPEALDVAVVGLPAPGGGDHVDDRGSHRRVDGRWDPRNSSNSSAARAWTARSSPRTAMVRMSRPRSSPVRSSSPSAACHPSSAWRAPASSRTKARNRSRGSPSSKRSHQPRPATSVRQTATSGSLGEAPGQLAEGRGGGRSGHHRRPGVVHEGVALHGGQLRLRRRGQPGAQRVVVGHPVEAVPSAVDHDDRVRAHEGNSALVDVEEDLRLLGGRDWPHPATRPRPPGGSGPGWPSGCPAAASRRRAARRRRGSGVGAGRPRRRRPTAPRSRVDSPPARSSCP